MVRSLVVRALSGFKLATTKLKLSSCTNHLATNKSIKKLLEFLGGKKGRKT